MNLPSAFMDVLVSSMVVGILLSLYTIIQDSSGRIRVLIGTKKRVTQYLPPIGETNREHVVRFLSRLWEQDSKNQRVPMSGVTRSIPSNGVVQDKKGIGLHRPVRNTDWMPSHLGVRIGNENVPSGHDEKMNALVMQTICISIARRVVDYVRLRRWRRRIQRHTCRRRKKQQQQQQQQQPHSKSRETAPKNSIDLFVRNPKHLPAHYLLLAVGSFFTHGIGFEFRTGLPCSSY